MEISYKMVEKIFNELPIGLYLGRRISAVLDENCAVSSFNFIDKDIEISYPAIASAVGKITDSNVLPMVIRSTLYHEISHAIMTPSELMEYWMHDSEMKKVLNIMEDQRIEEFLRYYYAGIDFKRNIELLNNWDENKNTPVRDAIDEFYRVVRFQTGKQKWVDRAKEIVEKYGNKFAYNLNCYNYVWETRNLYYEIASEFPSMSEDDLDKMFNSDSGMTGEGSKSKSDKSDDSKSESDKKDNPKSESKDKSNDKSENKNISVDFDDAKDSDEESKNCCETDKELDSSTRAMIASAVQKAIDTMLKVADPTEILKEIYPAIAGFKKRTAGGSAIAAHSGVLNPRLAARPDYKMFERKSQEHGANKFTSIHLNLFLDESGSYRQNVGKTNELIAALSKIEQMDKNFTFDIVYCGMGERLVKSKKDRYMHAEGGNRLDNEIFVLYNKLQKPSTYNYNIVLFDGDAFTDVCWGEKDKYHSNFGAFNHPNCTIISDPDNMAYINTYATSARRIFTNKYVDELHKNVISALKLAFR